MTPIRLAIRAAAVVALGLTAPAAGPARAEAPSSETPAAGAPTAGAAQTHSEPTLARAAPHPGASLFDPARHMRVSEVKAGMKGYGLSVFHGTRIERFDVEVLSILRNFNPKDDVVLISCKGANLEHTGAIAGMSGSPVFLRDDAGRERMIGAFAYGWPLAKDPIAGVQPIEYMLDLPTTDPRPALSGAGPGATGSGPSVGPGIGPGGVGRPESVEPRGTTWSLRDAGGRWEKLIHPAAATPPSPLWAGAGTGAAGGAAGRLTGGAEIPELRPLATPLMAGGLSSRALAAFGPALGAAGVVPLQAGGGTGSGGGAGDRDSQTPAAPLEPGSVLGVALLTGDVEMTALGTCTEVLGDRVFGFGHAFNGEGPVTLPMGSGRVNGIVATLSTSFKLGSLTRERGRLTADETVGVAGRIGEAAPTVPVELKVYTSEATGSASGAAGDASEGAGKVAAGEVSEARPRVYHFQAAQHPKFTPLLTGAAFAAAVGGTSELPEYNTVDYAIDLEFANGKSVHVADRAVNTNAADLFQIIGLAIVSAGENPFQRVPLKKMTGSIHVLPEARAGQILDVTVPRLKYKPGETVKGFITYKPFRAIETTLAVELELPRDLAAGTYQLVISDADRFLQDEQATKPFRFTARRASEIFEVLKDVTSIRHDALYLRLIRQPDGVAVGHTALPQLPGSRRQILLGSGRSDTTQFVSSTVKVIPTERVIAGSAEFAITIETKGRTEAGATRGPTSRPAAPGKGEEVKPKGRALESPDAPVPKDKD